MRGPRAGTACTTVRGCTRTPTHEITASGRLLGIPHGAPPKAIHLFACDAHLRLAQRQAGNRTTRKIELIDNQQPSLFDL